MLGEKRCLPEPSGLLRQRPPKCGRCPLLFYNGQNTNIAGILTATTRISSGSPMRQ